MVVVVLVLGWCFGSEVEEVEVGKGEGKKKKRRNESGLTGRKGRQSPPRRA